MGKRIGDYNEDDILKATPTRLAFKLLGVFLAVVAILSVVGFIGGWFKTGADIISPTNVKQQWQFAYTFDESLKAINTQWCSAKDAEDADTNPETKPQRTSQRLAIEQNYAKVKAQYDAQLANAFEAKWVKPSDVPDRAPELNKIC